ncbi:hypothetical protein AUP44_08110 [Tistrella mobilis]|uniref:Uncharacterized protein n=2 Tax=Tistrella mobilis TaxID=171437 RepID=A0A162KM91_9PROT|nr:hypothetical protein AUP44_08110 [Tistrella mobilis]
MCHVSGRHATLFFTERSSDRKARRPMTDRAPIETTDTTSKTAPEPKPRPNEPKPRPNETEAARQAAAERRARQAAQLRANLARRKAQSRDRAAEEEGL